MAYKTAALFFTFATWIQYDRKMEERWSQRHENIDSMNIFMEQQWISIKNKQEPQSQPEKKNITTSNEMERFQFTSAVTLLSGSLSLDIVSVILLIRMVGVDLLASFYEVVPQLSLFGNIIWVSLAIYDTTFNKYCKWRQSTIQDTEARGGQQQPLVPKNTHEDCAGIENEDGGRDRLNKVKTQLEEKKAHLDKQLQDVDNKREENKKELQSVEEKITYNEADDKEMFLRKKETLLQSQWKLDEEKKHFDRQRLDIENFLETLEF
ncbi:uncharacterized protein LOC119796096 [Cyprinodon tularosa]|uniref:uncharacterized protein LOC119796096 n=1 Tax=Cyprinodon tularosa TaxID=77115 RepID=UPI0018E24902|nr:uncharacterized protein LOC119796096 [Cyprinodon tularosa]